VAGRYTSSFTAAVEGFITWDFFGLLTRVSVVTGQPAEYTARTAVPAIAGRLPAAGTLTRFRTVTAPALRRCGAGRRFGGTVTVPADRHPATFRLLVVPGVTVDRWSRTWSERRPGVGLQLVPAGVAQAAALLRDQADAGLVRLPVDQDTVHAIPLYTEVTVVVVPREHVLAAAESVTVADLAGETVVRPLDDVLTWASGSAPPAPMAAERPATTAAAVELVAAGAGILVVPQSLARLYHRRDLTYRVVTDAPTSSVALVWLRDRYTDLVEEMIGIVRGRTANSTRGRAQAPATSAEPSVRTPTEGGATHPTPATRPAGARRGGPNPRRRGR
jgi:hypothetical protein